MRNYFYTAKTNQPLHTPLVFTLLVLFVVFCDYPCFAQNTWAPGQTAPNRPGAAPPSSRPSRETATPSAPIATTPEALQKQLSIELKDLEKDQTYSWAVKFAKYVVMNKEKNYSTWKKAADLNIPEGQLLCGYSPIAEGITRNAEGAIRGIRPNESTLDEAVKMISPAAEQGLAEAQYCLAGVYYLMGGDVNGGKAFQWYQKAVDQDFVPAYNDLGTCYQDDTGGCTTGDRDEGLKIAIDLIEKGAMKNDCVAQNSMGTSYNFGIGRPKDRKKATEWFLKSAKQGYARAQFNLAKQYEDDGKYGEACEWYEKAILQDNVYGKAQAMVNLGYLLQENSERLMDHRRGADLYEEVTELFQKTLEQFEVNSIESLGEAIDRIHPDFVEAASVAHLNLGNCYNSGKGRPRNMVEANKNYLSALVLGNEVALQICIRRGIIQP